MNDFIKLFDATDKVFTSNGITTMKPLKLKETKKISLNGWFIDVEVDLKYKDFLEQDMLAVIKTKSKINPQAFRIDNLNYNKRTITFTAHHVMFDAHDYYLVDVRPTSMGAVGALNYVNERTDKTSPFSFTSDVNNSQTAYFLDRSLFYAMQVIAEQWGGYYDADNWNVNLKNVIGVDRGDTISYGKNLEDIKVYENWSDVVTKVYPVGFDGLRLPEVYLQSEVQYEVPYTKRVDFETKFEDEEQTEENMLPELRANATEFINNNYLPKVSYEVVSNINQRLDIGDTVSVKHPLVSLVTEVQEYEYDVLKGRVVKLVFGNYVRDVKTKVGSIKDDIKKNSNQIQVAESKFQQIIGEQTDIINNMNKLGHVYQDDNQILILDKLPKEDAVNVWRWNLGGLAFSENGIEGPYKQAWTMDGTFNTAFIAANSILTNQLSSDVGSSLDISSNVAITQIVEQIANGNLLTNGSGEMGFVGWIGGSTARYVTPLIRYIEGLTYSMGFIPQTNPLALSETELSFYSNGFDVSPMAFIVPDMEHSYRAKIMRFKPFNIDVLEFNSLDNANNMVVNKTTKFTFNTSVPYVEFTFTPSASTQYVRFKYNRTGVTPTDRLNIAEVMFNRGQPKEWQLSPLNAVVYSQSTRVQLSDRITDTVEKIEIVDGKTVSNKSMIDQLSNKIVLGVDSNGKIVQVELGVNPDDGSYFVVKAENISLEGVTTINGNFKVLANGDVEFNNAKGTNMDITGKVTATSGKIAGFDISGNNLVGTDVALRPNEVQMGESILKNVAVDGRLGVKGKGLVVGYETLVNDSNTNVIRWGSLSGLGTFFGVHNGSDTALWAINDIKISNISGSSKIGSSSTRLGNIYLQNQPNVSSDARFKFNIKDIDPFLLDMIAEYVIPKMYETQFDDKSHFGYIAQDVETAFYKYFYQSSINNGMDKLEASRLANGEIKMFALLSKDESYMSLLYGEIAVLMDAYNRMKNNELEDRISKLERLINYENNA